MSATPFLKWAGGKRGLLPELEKRVPKFSGTYFEPFLGGGALFFHLAPSFAMLSDVNTDLVNAYQTVKELPNELIRELETKENDEKFYYAERGRDPVSDVDAAARFLYLNRVCFNGLYRVNGKGKFNVPFGSYRNPDIVQREKICEASTSLQGAFISTLDFEVALEGASANSFVYLDPPYAPVSATSNFTSFSKGGFSDGEQARLRDCCLRLKARGVPFLLSNSDAEIVRDLYSGPEFRVETVYAKRSINSKGGRRGAVPELLIS